MCVYVYDSLYIGVLYSFHLAGARPQPFPRVRGGTRQVGSLRWAGLLPQALPAHSLVPSSIRKLPSLDFRFILCGQSWSLG